MAYKNLKIIKRDETLEETYHRTPEITTAMVCGAVAECGYGGTGDIAKRLGLSQNGVLAALKKANDGGLLDCDLISGNTYIWTVAELKENKKEGEPRTKYDNILLKFKRQSQATDLYVVLLLESPCDAQKLLELNAAIIRRWSKTGLKSIKKDAWARCNGV